MHQYIWNWQQRKILHKAYLKAICSKTENIFWGMLYVKKRYSVVKVSLRKHPLLNNMNLVEKALQIIASCVDFIIFGFLLT